MLEEKGTKYLYTYAMFETVMAQIIHDGQEQLYRSAQPIVLYAVKSVKAMLLSTVQGIHKESFTESEDYNRGFEDAKNKILEIFKP